MGRDGGAREIGTKLSILGGYGKADVDNSNFTASNLNGDSRSYSSTLNVESFELGMIAGYRFESWFLLYLAGNYRSSDAGGSLTSDSFSHVEIRNKAIIRSAQLGLQFNNENRYILLEGGVVESMWGGSKSRTDYTLGFSFALASK